MNNLVEAIDSAALTYALPRITPEGQITDDPTYGWAEGLNVWSIPFGWNVCDTADDTPHYGAFASDKTQAFAIDVFGNTEVRKLNHVSRREISNDVYLDGVMQ